MQNLIVTHFNPDLDAICCVWLLKKYDLDFQKSKVVFVPAGNTYKNQTVDKNDHIIHVDTGLGRFDHHQYDSKICASQLVFNYLKSKNKYLERDDALLRLIKLVCEIDHFGECLWPQADSDRYQFFLPELLSGLKISGELDDYGLIDLGGKLLTGLYMSLIIRIKALQDLRKGLQFQTVWGKAIGCLSHNDEVLKLGQKMGYILVVQKDVQTDMVRIKGRPDSLVNLTKTKSKLSQLDPKATWFLHVSKRMLLNGSSKNPKMKPSKLGLKKIIDVLKAT